MNGPRGGAGQGGRERGLKGCKGQVRGWKPWDIAGKELGIYNQDSAGLQASYLGGHFFHKEHDVLVAQQAQQME